MWVAPAREVRELREQQGCPAQVQLPRPTQALYRVIGNPSVRLSAVLALVLVAVWGWHASNASQDADLNTVLEVRAA
jgi:hypothetical protein